MSYCLSVVVTIYNIEKYLDECIESILNQKYKELEIILVDDGSTDCCLEICRKYAERDSRVKVITKENGGLVSARKVGIENATGEYITFVDGDDYLDSDYYSKMMDGIMERNPDLYVASCTIKDGNKLTPIRQSMPDGIYSGSKLTWLHHNMNFYNFECYSFGINPSVCMKIFKTELLKTGYANIPQKVTFGEDACFSFPYILKTKSIVVDNTINGYIYRVVNNSMSRSEDYVKLLDSYYVYDYLKSFYYETNDHEIIAQVELYKTYLAEHALHSMMDSVGYKEVSERTAEIKTRVSGSLLFEDIERMLDYNISKRFRKELTLIREANWRLFERQWKKRLVLFYLRTTVRSALKRLLKVFFPKHMKI